MLNDLVLFRAAMTRGDLRHATPPRNTQTISGMIILIAFVASALLTAFALVL